ncbi:hypothetical protein JCM8097_009341 [Rhodosporidiobolus ruineniae]
MRTVLALAAAASFSSAVLAQTVPAGYGRFPCTIVNGDGTFSPDPSQCAAGNLVAPGTGTGNQDGNQGDGVLPTTPACQQEPTTGAYYCGIQGAACTTSANCDNGACINGACTGGLNAGCFGNDANCLGFLYCNDPDFNPTAAGTCGGIGSFCQDYTQGIPGAPDATNYAIFNQFCASGYCNTQTGACDNHVLAVGASCATDPNFACTVDATTGQALTCDPVSLTCQVAAVPSGGARRERRQRSLYQRSLCPASHQACSIEGSKGFECIDTQTNLEQCGACANKGGVDCTQLPGVAAVGCVAGTCEIWSCESGYSWDSLSNACVRD